MLKILVVDDSEIQRIKLRKLLSENFEVLEAKNGQEALGVIEGNNLDCIITDLLMPIMDGLQLMEKLKAAKNEIPVVVMTADIQDTTRKKCLELGALDIIGKPFSGEQFREILRKTFLSRAD